MKFVKLQKASIKKQATLTDEQLNWLKQEYADTMFDPFSNKDHYELNDDMAYALELHFNLDEYNMNESDFKLVTGLSYEEYDKQLESIRQKQQKDEFELSKNSDLMTLEDILDENKFELDWTKEQIQNILFELKSK